MAKKAPRTTYSARMLTDAYMRKCVDAKMRECADAPTHSLICSSTHSRIRGFTLTETIVAVVVISLFVLLAQVSLFGLLRKNTFKAQAQELVSTMQMAARGAAESDRRYEVIIDLTEQSYLLRQITSPDLSQVLEEEIIVNNDFSDNCWVAYVLFDDVDYSLEDESYTNEGQAKFRAGHAGWQYGGKIVLFDRDERPYSIVINRLNRIVMLKKGDVEILKPKAKEDVPF